MSTSACPRCAAMVAADPDPVSGTVHCEACGTRFDPRQDATAAAGADAPDSWQPAVGEMVDGYRLDAEIGRGGMATVWRARQDSLGRDVALKILHAHLSVDEDLQRRFQREADALVQLDHPHVLPVFDRGEYRDRPYLVMQLVGSRTLRDELGGSSNDGAGSTQLHPKRVAELARQILGGLAHAHDHHLIHRDIKPANILLDEHGTVRVADFGIARVRADVDGNTLTELTRTDVVVGTVAYMAPEQSERGATVDQRCDLYSLGVVLYEALVGHRPQGRFEDPAEALTCCATEAAAWNRLVLSLLERRASKRPPSARAALQLLGAVESAQAAADAPLKPAAQAHATKQAKPAKPARATPPPHASSAFPHGRRLLRDQNRRWFGGVCGGLGAWLGVHSDWIRWSAILGPLFLGPGYPAGLLIVVVGYVLAMIAIPPCTDEQYRPRPLNYGLPQRGNGWFLGVCDLLATTSTVPAWVWRVAAVIGFPFGSWIAYLVVGIVFPRRAPGPYTAQHRAINDHDDDNDLQHSAGSGFRFWGLLTVTLASIALALGHLGMPSAAPGPALWLASGAALLAALAAGGRSTPRSGALGGVLTGCAIGALCLLGITTQHGAGTIVGLDGIGLGLAVLGGLATVLALLLRRASAVVHGAAGLSALGSAVLALHVAQRAGWDIGWSAILGVGLVGWALASATLRPLLPPADDDGRERL
ncbi:MAG: protein kinase, partial [Planctomycetota bacterium]|nr:protein kinase [Planctomycetota bacterium]